LDFHLGRDAVTPVAEVLVQRGIPFLAASAAVDLVALGGPVFQGIQNLGKPVRDTEMVLAANRIADASTSDGALEKGPAPTSSSDRIRNCSPKPRPTPAR
jgi:hypothetical protein